MLTQIHIKNLTLIDQLSLELTPGLTVLTGETGAGKSIWVDAVQLALGMRADHMLIRPHCERGEISLCFDLTHIAAAQKWLQAQALDDDSHECIIRRLIERNSRSRCSINGRPVALSMLQEFTPLLLSIHGQHQHHHLLREENQQQHIDQYAQLEPQLAVTKALFQQWHTLEQQIAALQHQLDHRKSELDLLRYQLDEIDTFAPQEDEWQQLIDQYQRLAHSEKSAHKVNQVLYYLQDQESYAAITQLQQAQQELKALTTTPFPQIPTIYELLQQADIYLQEALDELNRLHRCIEINPEKLAATEQRLTQLRDLARKHHVEPNELKTVQTKLQQQMSNLNQLEEKMAHLKTQQTALLKQYRCVTQPLTQARQQAAHTISEQVTTAMQHLGMQGSCFMIELIPRETTIHPLGQEKMRFLVQTNPGQPPQPLAKIVSGGELSRIHLALQALIAQKVQTPTLIFDEVDVGIGGKTAAIVGKLLRQLSESTQVICITHLPQVAACGHQHYRVSKTTHQQQTVSSMQALNFEARMEELARMLGGTRITTQTRAHAAELLQEHT